MPVSSWSTTPASNTGILTGITLDGASLNVPLLDDAFREMAAQIAAQLGKVGFKGADMPSAATVDLSTATGWYCDVTGTTTITSLGTVAAGQVFILRFASSLTLTHHASTLILPQNASVVTQGGDVGIFVSLGGGGWRCINYEALGGSLPAGTVVDFAGTTAPTGWLMCYGQSVSRATYAALFAAIGTTYGTADGSSFNLPDLRGRVTAGRDDMGGTGAARLTGGYLGGMAGGGHVLGGVGGEQAHQITVAEMANHAHGGNTTGRNVGHQHYVHGVTDVQGAHSHTIAASFQELRKDGSLDYPMKSGGSTSTSVDGAHAHNWAAWTDGENVDHLHFIYAEGGNVAHNNVQPTIIMQKIIKV